MAIRKINNKMEKSEVLLTDPILQPHIPETHWYSPKTFWMMLGIYPTVFIKPNTGLRGSGIIRVQRLKSKMFEVRFDDKVKKVPQSDLITEVTQLIEPDMQYFVQEGINLATVYNGRPFDIRIIMHKPENRWNLCGWVAKVAGPNQFVTNYAKGGKAFALEKVLKDAGFKNIEKILQTLGKIAHRTSHVLDKSFSDLRILGIDAALDKKGKVWFIEANTRPGYNLFRDLGDQVMFHRIITTHHYIHAKYKEVVAASTSQVTAFNLEK
ncbi:YheC/YheD family protein [Polycladomyces subterraneus]|uniref:YheC/YheD family protein n=1 Tax=Polycladomyces subterraneus TaxID=1016997 RepID=A0ABT8IMW7_9BACL|nr:YheC/YheD family protein [Polycladomyces subterraneus]MDN4594155.1 YheC/YheD family protein [Polycladomyces subterraneus]